MRIILFIVDFLIIGMVVFALVSAYLKGKDDSQKKGGEKDVKLK